LVTEDAVLVVTKAKNVMPIVTWISRILVEKRPTIAKHARTVSCAPGTRPVRVKAFAFHVRRFIHPMLHFPGLDTHPGGNLTTILGKSTSGPENVGAKIVKKSDLLSGELPDNTSLDYTQYAGDLSGKSLKDSENWLLCP